MRRKLIVKIIALFIMLMFLLQIKVPYIKGNDSNKSDEYLDVFIVGEGLFWRLYSEKPLINISNFLDMNLVKLSAITEIKLTFSILNNWSSSYNLLISSPRSLNYTLDCIRETMVVIRIHHTIEGDEEALYQVIDKIGSSLNLNFILVNESEDELIFISSLDPQRILRSEGPLFKALSWNLTGVFSLLNTDTVIKSDYSLIDLIIKFNNDYNASATISIYSFMKNPSIESGEFNLSSIFPDIAKTSARNDTRSTYVRILIKNANVYMYPNDFNVTRINDIVVIYKEYQPGSSLEDVKIMYTYKLPELVIERHFNSTYICPNTTINVKLIIRNLGDVDAENVAIEEYPWWTEYEGINLKDSNEKLMWNLKKVPQNGVEELSYEVTINENFTNNFIFISAAKATITLAGNISYTYYSSTNIVHTENDSPILYISISDFSGFNLSYTDELSYFIVIINNGSNSVHDVVIGDIYIPQINPKETRKVLFKAKATSDLNNIIYINYSLQYKYLNKQFTMNTQVIPIMFRPCKSFLPAIKTSIMQTEKNEQEFVIKYKIKNICLSKINKVSIKGLVFDYEFEIENSTIVDKSFSLNLGELDLDEETNLTVTIRLDKYSATYTPLITVFLYNDYGSTKHILPVKPIINSVRVYLDTLPDKLIRGIEYKTKLIVENLGDQPIYDVRVIALYSGLSVYLRNNTVQCLKSGSHVVNITIIGKNPGNYTISKFSAYYVFGGIEQSIHMSGLNITVYQGLDVKIMKNKISVLEGDTINVTIRITRDIDEIKKINLRWLLPKGLMFDDKNEEYNVTITFDTNEKTINIKVASMTPGIYIIDPPEIMFEYRGKWYSINTIGIKLEKIKISVYENLIQRYWIYFIPMLIISIISVSIVRKSISGKMREK